MSEDNGCNEEGDESSGNQKMTNLSQSKELQERMRKVITQPCGNDDQLHAWLKVVLGLDVPRVAVCKGHDAPFDYVRTAYFEPGQDMVVWAPRGGGKTRLGAALTLLDLLHKPGVQARILGGSFDQSTRMWEHLREDINRVAKHLVDPEVRDKYVIKMMEGAKAGVLSQSQKAVRGLRVQKLRCDEVEMFDEKVWEAAQFVTRSMSKEETGAAVYPGGADGVRGTVEAISTFHRPWGVMNGIVENAEEKKIKVVKWCVLDVMERCPERRVCRKCDLEKACGGVAKWSCNGFVSIEDVLIHQRRVSFEAFESEHLCKRPSARGCVFPSFCFDTHVREEGSGFGVQGSGELRLAMDFGFANPFVCLWIRVHANGVTHVIDEYVQPGQVMHEHVKVIESREWGKAKIVACDPAGAGRNDQTAESNVQLLKRNGYAVRSRGSGILEGIEMIRLGLKPAAGKATLFISPRCKRLIKAMQGYHYAPGGSELPVKDGEHDHLIDALRYHFVNLVGTGARGGRMY